MTEAEIEIEIRGLMAEIKACEELIAKLEKKREKLQERLEIKCACCENEMHKIEDLTVIQTYWYVRPFGCTGGDYWNKGEVNFICPKTGYRNRLLFDTHDVPYDKRQNYAHNPEMQFQDKYMGLFKEQKDTHGEEKKIPWVNNYYVDRNRAKFGLVEKVKKA